MVNSIYQDLLLLYVIYSYRILFHTYCGYNMEETLARVRITCSPADVSFDYCAFLSLMVHSLVWSHAQTPPLLLKHQTWHSFRFQLSISIYLSPVPYVPLDAEAQGQLTSFHISNYSNPSSSAVAFNLTVVSTSCYSILSH